jgi:hypothetical protein
MMKINNAPSECKCSKCVCNQEQIARFNKDLIDLDDERVRQSMLHEHKISELNDEYSYKYRLLEAAKAEEKQLKVEHSSRNQSEKEVLEEVGRPQPNTTLRTPDPSNIRNKENGY